MRFAPGVSRSLFALIVLMSATSHAATIGVSGFVASGRGPGSLAVADFNRAGRLDLASANGQAARGQQVTVNSDATTDAGPQFSPAESSKPAATEPEPAQPRLLQQLDRDVPIVSQSVSSRGISIKAERAFEHMTVSLITPDGQHFTTKVAGGTVNINPYAIEGFTVIDGVYTWEARLLIRGAVPADVRKRAEEARESGDVGAETAMRFALRRGVQVQSGAFTILGGRLYAGQEAEPGSFRDQAAVAPGSGLGKAPFARINFASAGAFAAPPPAMRDQVIPDDLIVQGSACVGLDCVNNENFGFDTIRVKENNLRIHFDDTSVSAGFPANDWRIVANDSASGGASKFSVEDSTGAKTPFTLTAGAPTNSLFVSSVGNVGFGTSTPVLDLHINTSDSPAIRLEQNNTGGFTAQTWDIAGNEANFFVRDVTSGSRLPFRIRPGAPTSSIDISADGQVGIGTASPETKLHVFGSATSDVFVGLGPNPDGSPAGESGLNIGYAGNSIGRGSGFFNIRPDSSAAAPNPSLRFLVANTERMIIDNEGYIGLGVANPNNPIHHLSGATLSGVGVWTDASSRAYKKDIRTLGLADAKTTLAGLKPVTFTYRLDPSDPHVGFIAEDVPDLVATPDRTGLSAMDIVAVLTRVVQEQQKTIAELAAKVKAIEARRPK